MTEAVRNVVRLPPGFSLLQEDPPASPDAPQVPAGFRLLEDMSAEELAVPSAPGDAVGDARRAELDRRNAKASAEEKAWLGARSPSERVKDTAAFVASAPVRAFTSGNKGLGDILRAVGLSGYAEGVEQSEADFARANPDVIHTLGAAGEVAAGIPALNTMGRIAPPRAPAGQPRPISTNAQRAVTRAAEATEDMGAAQRLNVELPGMAFNEGPVASVGKQLSETPIIGTPGMRSIQRGVTETAQAAEQVASRYGDVQTAHQMGQVIDQGIRRFKDARPADVLDDAARNLTPDQISDVVRQPARETSLKSKQAALYERAWREIPEDMRGGRSVEGAARVMGAPENTRAVLQTIVERNAKMTIQSGETAAGTRMPVTGGPLRDMLEAISNKRWTANLQTMRDMRSEIRRLASGMADTEKNVLKHSDLERLQGALTQDMVALLQRNADNYRAAGRVQEAVRFERSIRLFRQADRFTRLSAERLETIEHLFNANSAEALSRNIMQAAMTQGRGNIEALRVLGRTLRDQEMSQVTSGVIRMMGDIQGSARGLAQEAGFSVNRFVTSYQNMTPMGRMLLFRGPHRAAVDDLVRVSNRLSNVEALANTSRSGTNSLNVGAALASVGTVATGALDAMVTGGLTLGGGFGLSLMLSRPTYTKWLVKYLRGKARVMQSADGKSALLAEAVRELGVMAKQDPDLMPIYEQISRDEN